MSKIHPDHTHHNETGCHDGFRSMSAGDQLAGAVVVFLVLLLAIVLKFLL